MKSARVTAFAPHCDAIRVEDVPLPEPGPGEVRVRMQRAPIHPSDFNALDGTYHRALQRVVWNVGRSPVRFSPSGAVVPEPPYTPGAEGVGMVEAAGRGVWARRLLGRRVAVAAGPPCGTWQQATVVPARKAVPVPAGLPDEQAAMLLVNPLTAYVLVRHVAVVRRGGWLLQSAAGSALAGMVRRLVTLRGGRTIDVVRSAAGAERLRAAGVRHVLATEVDDVPRAVADLTGGRGVAAALDCVGGEVASSFARALGLGGKLVLYGTLGSDPLVLPPRDLMMPAATIRGFYLPSWMLQQPLPRLLLVMRALRRLAARGVFTTSVAATFGLDALPEALAAARAPGRVGKVLLALD